MLSKNGTLHIIFSLVLIITGALLGDGYKNTLFCYWLVAMIVITLYSQYLLFQLDEASKTYQELMTKISVLSIGKGNHRSPDHIQCTVIPKPVGATDIRTNRRFQIEIQLVSQIPIINIPELKLTTKTMWKVIVDHQEKTSIHHANSYVYHLGNTALQYKVQDKFFRYNFDVEISSSGNQYFNIELDNGNEKIEVNNYFEVVGIH